MWIFSGFFTRHFRACLRRITQYSTFCTSCFVLAGFGSSDWSYSNLWHIHFPPCLCVLPKCKYPVGSTLCRRMQSVVQWFKNVAIKSVTQWNTKKKPMTWNDGHLPRIMCADSRTTVKHESCICAYCNDFSIMLKHSWNHVLKHENRGFKLLCARFQLRMA